MSKRLPLTLECDTLNAFKSDFNQMLRRLLFMMEQQEAEEGTLTAKMTVKLEQDQTRDYQSNGYDGKRDIVKPALNHKVGIALQFKDEKTGTIGGNYEMVWDKELNSYVMVEIDNGQTSMFADTDSAFDSAETFAQGIIDGMADELHDENLKELKEEFANALRFVGADMKIMGGGNNLYSVRTVNGGSIFLTSAGTAKSSFWIDPEVCAKHVDHNLFLQETVSGGKSLRVELRCLQCDEVIWCMDNPEEELGYVYEQPEG